MKIKKTVMQTVRVLKKVSEHYERPAPYKLSERFRLDKSLKVTSYEHYQFFLVPHTAAMTFIGDISRIHVCDVCQFQLQLKTTINMSLKIVVLLCFMVFSPAKLVRKVILF